MYVKYQKYNFELRFLTCIQLTFYLKDFLTLSNVYLLELRTCYMHMTNFFSDIIICIIHLIDFPNEIIECIVLLRDFIRETILKDLKDFLRKKIESSINLKDFLHEIIIQVVVGSFI